VEVDRNLGARQPFTEDTDVSLSIPHSQGALTDEASKQI